MISRSNLLSLINLPTALHSAPFPASLIKLDNGLTLIHQYTPAMPVAAVDVWVDAGSIAEPDHWSGMAHFLEHMIFKGTDRLPPGAFDWAIENYGGVTNAATSHDSLIFSLPLPRSTWKPRCPICLSYC